MLAVRLALPVIKHLEVSQILKVILEFRFLLGHPGKLFAVVVDCIEATVEDLDFTFEKR